MTTQAPAATLRLPVLLDQQFWFLGHDIRHGAGNALQRFGFVRWRAPGRGGTSCYVLPLNDEAPLRAVVCWGFAAYCGPVQFAEATPAPDSASVAASDGHDRTGAGLLLARHARCARLTTGPLRLPVHCLHDLPRAHLARTDADRQALHEALATLAGVFARYEAWARSALGDRYRLDTLAALPRHKQKRFEHVADLSALWSRLVH